MQRQEYWSGDYSESCKRDLIDYNNLDGEPWLRYGEYLTFQFGRGSRWLPGESSLNDRPANAALQSRMEIDVEAKRRQE